MYKRYFSGFTKAPVILMALLVALALPFVSLPEITRATVCTLGTRCDKWNTPEGDTSWYSGGGVQVYSNGSQAGVWDPATQQYDDGYAGKYNCYTLSGGSGGLGCGPGTVPTGIEWQCVELFNRFYMTRGWITSRWTGSGNTLKDLSPLPTGFSVEGATATTYINPGDAITFTDGAPPYYSGHVVIVDYVEGTGTTRTVHVVSQNTQGVLWTVSWDTSTKTMTQTYLGKDYLVQAIIHRPVGGGGNSNPSMRIGELDMSGTFQVKENGLSTSWVPEYSGVNQGVVAGSMVGVVTSDGAYRVKRGDLGSTNPFTYEYSGATSGVLSDGAGTSTSPFSIGVLTNDGHFKVKQNDMNGQWTDMWTSGGVVAGYLTNTGTTLRIGVLLSDGTLYAKDGLNSLWGQAQATGVTQASFSGNLMGAMMGNTFYAKAGLGGGWTGEWSPAVEGQVSDASGSVPLHIGALSTNGHYEVKDTSLGGSWHDEYSNVAHGGVSGDYTSVLTTGGTYWVKSGGVNGTNWTPEWTNAVGGATSGESSDSSATTLWGGVGNATGLGTQLTVGQTMHSNQYLVSGNVQYALMMQADGNLVLYSRGHAIWANNMYGNPGAYLTLQSDGNIVEYTSGGAPLWGTGTNGQSLGYLILQDDGNLVAYSPSNAPLWGSGTSGHPTYTYIGGNWVNPDQPLTSGEYTRSTDGRYALLMQTDGNLVVYGPGFHDIWSNGWGNHPGAYLILQDDGNIVEYSASGSPLWGTGTVGQTTTYINMQTDGDLAAYDSYGVLVWESGSTGKI